MGFQSSSGSSPDGITITTNSNSQLTITGSDEVLSLRNHVRSLILAGQTYSKDKNDLYGEAYVSATGRNASVNTNFANSNMCFDTDNYSSNPFIIIQATSLNVGDFAINNCIMTLMSSGKWKLQCTSGVAEVRIAQMMKTLFYGSNGTDARAKNTYITGIIAIKCSWSRAVGKRAYYMAISAGSGASNSMTGIFTDTSANTSVESWSYVSMGSTTAAGGLHFEIPTGSELNCRSGQSGAYTNDETGTNTTADIKSNPANLMASCYATSSASEVRGYILTKGTISFTGGTNIDFQTTHSIPDFVLADSSDYADLLEHSLPANYFNTACKKSLVSCVFKNIDSGSSIQYKLTNGTDDTGWLDVDCYQNFTPFASAPTKLILKIIANGNGTIGYPQIQGCGIRVL